MLGANRGNDFLTEDYALKYAKKIEAAIRLTDPGIGKGYKARLRGLASAFRGEQGASMILALESGTHSPESLARVSLVSFASGKVQSKVQKRKEALQKELKALDKAHLQVCVHNMVFIATILLL